MQIRAYLAKFGMFPTYTRYQGFMLMKSTAQYLDIYGVVGMNLLGGLPSLNRRRMVVLVWSTVK